MDLSKEFYDGRWEQGNIPIKLRGLVFEDYRPVHHSGKIALYEARDFVDSFTDHYVSTKRAANGNIPDDRTNIGKGLMLYGRNGTRKTTLAAAILTEIQYKSPAFFGFYIRFSDWKRCLTDTFSKEETERSLIAKRMLRMAEIAPIVVLDDIGQEHRTISGFTESSLHEFLRIRYELARPTIITTNIDPDQMRETYGPSFDSFRHDAFDSFEMLGRDSRKSERN